MSFEALAELQVAAAASLSKARSDPGMLGGNTLGLLLVLVLMVVDSGEWWFIAGEWWFIVG